MRTVAAGTHSCAATSSRPAHTHQMPTSLLLLSIQVSAALNLAEELPVTFCGRGREISSVLGKAARAPPCCWIREALSHGLCTPQTPVLLAEQQTGKKEI